MKPINFSEKNKIFKAPKGMLNCMHIPVYNDSIDTISCWRGSFWDRLRFLFSGKMWMCVHAGETQPPVWISTHYPFENPVEVSE